MPISPLVHTDSFGRPLHAILSLQTLKTLDTAGIAALHDVGIHSVGQLLHWNPVHHARTLMAIARGEIGHDVGVSKLLDAAYVKMPLVDIPGAPTVTVYQIGEHISEVLASVFGVTTVEELASFRPFMEAEAYLLPSDLAFQEPLSAPLELIPKATGAVTSSMRFSTFVREVDLRNMTIHVSPSALADVPIGEVFTGSEKPVIHLGYVAGYIQRWSGHGTHLGEVIHSLPLAPGESRNVTIVDWKRRQFTRRGEESTVREYIDSTQVHKRALDEVARAVAEEHQYGKTATEASTGVTSGSFVAAGAVAGGVAGGVVGAIGGGVTGLAISAIVSGVDAGAATIAGTVTGGLGGAIAGSAAGAAAGGLIFSGATAMGLIESSSEGDREVIARTVQNITQSTIQKSSAIRSLWSTIVLEGVQSEQAEIQTTNVTNYNHMHALTIQYYEVLQHYRTTLMLGSVRPLIFIPFRPLSFTFAQIEALWPYLEATVRQTVSQIVIEDAFSTLPPQPVAPPVAGGTALGPDTKVTRLTVETRKANFAGSQTVSLTENDGTTEHAITYRANERYEEIGAVFDIFRSNIDVVASRVSKIRVSFASGSISTRLRVRIKYRLFDPGTQTEQVRDEWLQLGSQQVDAFLGSKNVDFTWNIASQLAAAQAAGANQNSAAEQAYQNEVAIYEDAVERQQQARGKLEELFLWRRYEFTRAILAQTEPQQLNEIFEEMTLAIDENATVPLHRIAHTIPVGTTGYSFVFELKRNRYEEPGDLAPLIDLPSGVDVEKAKAEQLVGYAHRLLNSFETDERAFDMSESVFLPTSGVFAEAILGRSNSAEKLDITRFFNWQDSPIPNPAPAIAAADPNADRNVDQTLAVTMPSNTINLVSPATFPDPSGLTAVLQAVQNGSMFRDMSKSSELSSIIGSLSTLAGEMGKASSQMTGNAAEQSLKSATDLAKAVADLSKTIQQPGGTQKAAPPATLTEKGATITQLEKLLKDAMAEVAKLSGGGAGSAGSPANSGSTGEEAYSARSLAALIQIAEFIRVNLDVLGIGGPPTVTPVPNPAKPESNSTSSNGEPLPTPPPPQT